MMGFAEHGRPVNDGRTKKKGLPEECRIPMEAMGKTTTTTTTTTTTRMDGSHPVDQGHGLLETTLRRLDVDPERGLTMAQVVERRAQFGPNELATSKKEGRRRAAGGLLVMRLWDEWEGPIRGYLEQFQNPLIMLLIGSALVSLLLGQLENAVSIALAVLVVGTVGFVQEYRTERSLEALNRLAPPKCRVIREGATLERLAVELVPGDVVRVELGDRVPADVLLLASVGLEVDESMMTGEQDARCKRPLAPGCRPGREAEAEHVLCMGTLVKAGHGLGVVVATGGATELGRLVQLVQATADRRSPLQASLDGLGRQLTVCSAAVIGLIALGGLLQHRPALEIFTVAVSLAVAAIPEGLPVVATITLALGVLRLSRRNVIVRKLPAVEALGSVTVLCADKTGTLTTNVLSVQCILPAEGDPLDMPVAAGGNAPRDAKGVAEMLRIGALCNNAKKGPGGGGGGGYTGNAMDIALMALLEALGEADPRTTLSRSAEMPFSSDTKHMAVQYGDTFYVKGAPETVLRMIDPSLEDRWSPVLAARGLRTLAVASGPSMHALRLAGLFGLMDPPRPGIAGVLQRLAAAHLRVVMVTGDARETAVNLARSIGFACSDASSVIPGDALGGLSLPQLERVAIVYRALPQHKLQLVQALQQRLGAVVAMTGDGVNDAPALKMADIGVAMGKSGTDVAREAAKLILADDALARLLDGIHEGKAIFANIRHFVRFQLATSLAALGLIACSMFVPAAASGQPPLNPMQILLINIIMDGPPAQSLGVEPISPDVLARPPRPRDSPILSRELLVRTALSAAYVLAGCLSVFYWECQVAPGDSTRTFAAFVLFSLFNAYSCRSLHKSVWALGLWRNTFLNASIGVALLTLAGILYTPWLSRVFQTTPLPLWELGILSALAASLLAFDELVKMASGWDAWHASTSGYIPISHVGDS